MKVAVHARIEDYQSIEQALVHHKSLGFRALEMDCPWHFFSNFNSQEMKILLKQKDIAVHLHIRPLDVASFVQKTIYEKECLEFQRAIDVGSEIGASQVSIHPLYFGSQKLKRELKEKGVSLLRLLVTKGVERASAVGIAFSIESFCYRPFVFYSPQEFKEFLDEAPGLGVILETGHLFQMGFNLSEMVALFGNKIRDVHVHDATQEKDFEKSTHLPLGKGLINFKDLLSDLRSIGYDGWLTLEIKPHTDIDALMRSRVMLEGLIATVT
jgi:sugar phosphate isomerase/epimerase